MSGVLGIYGTGGRVQAAQLTYLALYALQHRGQESAGMAVSDGHEVRLQKGLGLLADVFSLRDLEGLPGPLAIGHVGYPGPGGLAPVGAQPFLGHTGHGPVAVAHSGELTNAAVLRRRLQEEGAVFHSATDAEVLLHMVSRRGGRGLVEAVAETAGLLDGGFASVVMDAHRIVGFRDPAGIRPLAWGRGDGFFAVASETSALASLGVEEWEDVPPGHMAILDQGGVRLQAFGPQAPAAPCAFEFIYFARPDSEMEGKNVHEVRKAIGRILWEERPVAADVVIPAPDSGVSAAMGFAEASGLPFETGLIKNRYVGRTFIQPSGTSRELGVRIKLNPIRAVLKGRRVVVIDDSIVRGTTSRATIQLVREAGAVEVHMYVASPPFRHPCYYGIHIRSAEELVAASRTTEEVRRYIGADSLHYLGHEGLAKAIGLPADRLCMACMTGGYPRGVPQGAAAP